MTHPPDATPDRDETLRAREAATPAADAVVILTTYTRRPDGALIVNLGANPNVIQAVNAVMRRFNWASLIRGEGWLIPADKLRVTSLALKGNDVTLLDADVPAGYFTLQPPDARDEVYAPQPECRECAAPYRASHTAGDGEACWSCGAPLTLVRARIL